MGAAELYITLLSVCERLLKVLKSVALTRAQNFPRLRRATKKGGSHSGTGGGGRGDEVTTRRWIIFFRRIIKVKWVEQQSSIITAASWLIRLPYP